jgi:uncharacterized protein (DUF433 family)
VGAAASADTAAGMMEQELPGGNSVENTGRVVLGRYIVADPKICHGQLTFRGTRIFVESVLNQVARGMDWESIVEEWGGAVTEPAIEEAVRLATEALFTYKNELVREVARKDGAVDAALPG